MHILNEESRYLHNCSYEELLEKPLTMKIFSLILEEKREVTTSQIHHGLKNMGFNPHRATLLTYLNTMAKHNILRKSIKKSNVAYWDIGYNVIDIHEIMRNEDIHFLKNFYTREELFFMPDGFHMYGFNRLFEKIYATMGLYKKEFDKINSILQSIRENFETLIEIKNDLIEKEIDRSMEIMQKREKFSDFDKIMFRMVYQLLTDHWDDITLPKWIKKENNTYVLNCDINFARNIQKNFFPEKRIGEILREVNGYKIKKDVYEFLDFQAQLYQSMTMPFILLIHEREFHENLLNKKLENIKNKLESL
ncbi:MAG: hypothetical protein FE046_02380 [Thermoplasmata archaeon]|nr:MAG: hypothetical protein FE046_02380 [Thermoplasmata archaeon]